MVVPEMCPRCAPGGCARDCARDVPEMCPRCAPGGCARDVPQVCFVPEVCPRCAPGVPEIVPQVCPRCASADYRVTYNHNIIIFISLRLKVLNFNISAFLFKVQFYV